MRLRPFQAWLLSLLLLLQWVGAFGICLRAHAAVLNVQVCTAEGTRNIPLPVPAEEPGPPAAGMQCPACQALPALDAPAEPALVVRIGWTPLPPWSPANAAAFAPLPRALPPPARAPPVPA